MLSRQNRNTHTWLTVYYYWFYFFKAFPETDARTASSNDDRVGTE